MKFKFKIQQYQTDAVNTVVKVFDGQPFKDKITYMRDLGKQTQDMQASIFDDGINGFENGTIDLPDDILLQNIRTLQLHNNIRQSTELSKPFGTACRCSLDIEMETGTGKTYCYIKSIFELNKRYGWSKFIVVVPSIAIREGVKKSFEQTEDHFFEQYGKKARYFIYNSKNLNQLDNFSASKHIYVMIINAQAFAAGLKEGAKNEVARIIYSKQDSFASRRPIDVIAANRPIVILDEPQKLSGDATQKGIAQFKPLFPLNYSATHRQTHNLVYVLDALDAYKKKLVKKIEVKGFELRNIRGTDGYVYLSQILLSPNKPPMARLVFEINYAKSRNREARIVKVEDNLYTLSAGKNMPPLEEYRTGYVVKEINPRKNTITFLNGIVLTVGEVLGDASGRDMRRVQIRETILSHFEKEERLFNMGIKCLSLFFIDEVAHYRMYDENGDEQLGDFGVMFEQEYTSALNEYIQVTNHNSVYVDYLQKIAVADTHKGYFSIDKKTHRVINSKEKANDEDNITAYDLILKNKERLLSFKEPTRFIFSHSALREGWDNPNIFQICTLKQSNSEINKRQEVGRGMRLCVNQYGERIDGTYLNAKVHDINVLTVVASDSYKNFVTELQSDIQKDLYKRPTKATKDYFVGKHIVVNGADHEVTEEEADDIRTYLRYNGYIETDGTITDSYRQAETNNIFATVPPQLAGFEEGIHKLMQGIFDPSVLSEILPKAGKPNIVENTLNENFYKKEFQALWKKINHKYAYTVQLDTAKLIERSIAAINDKLYITELTYVRTVGSQGKDRLEFTEGRTKTTTLHNTSGSHVTYDLIGKIAETARITRKTAAAILKGILPSKFAMFKHNPEEFIARVSRYIVSQKASLVVDTITYAVTEEQPYSVDIFTTDAGVINFDKALKAKRHVTPYVVYDSTVERNFAEGMDKSENEVCVYAKLPRSFKIPTPVGDYAPDWAIAFYEGAVKYVYFVAETKGSTEENELRGVETEKISCVRRLFETVENGAVKFDVVDSYKNLLDVIGKV